MDTIWSLRSAYSQARRLKIAQDEFCSLAEANSWDSITDPFPEEAQYEVLIDVLRGRVKVSSQCQEAVDLDALIRVSHLRYPYDGWLLTGCAALKRVQIPDCINTPCSRSLVGP